MKSHQPVGDGIVQVMGCSKKMVDHVSSGSAIGYAVTIPIVVPLLTFLGGHVHQFCLGCPLWPTLEIDDYMHVLVDCTPGCTHPTILSFVDFIENLTVFIYVWQLNPPKYRVHSVHGQNQHLLNEFHLVVSISYLREKDHVETLLFCSSLMMFVSEKSSPCNLVIRSGYPRISKDYIHVYFV